MGSISAPYDALRMAQCKIALFPFLSNDQTEISAATPVVAGVEVQKSNGTGYDSPIPLPEGVLSA
jgi:hypothetical protein